MKLSLALLFLFSVQQFNTLSAAVSPLESDPAASIVSSSAQEITIDFKLPEITFGLSEQLGGERDVIVTPSEGMTYEYGKPTLPVTGRFVVVPPDAGLELIVRSGRMTRVRAERSPALCLDEEIRPEGENVTIGVDELYPPQIAEMSDPEIIRGVRLVRIWTYPVQYDPQAQEYIYHENIQTEIRFTDAEPVNPATLPVRRNRSKTFLRFIDALALNGADVGRDDPDRDKEPEYVGHYLVVTHENCLEYAAPFIEWRRKSGWKMDIANLSSGDASNVGRVKSAIQDRYDAYLDDGVDPFDELLLIGDRQQYTGGGHPAANWVLGAPQGVGSSPAHSDWDLGMVEGNDRMCDLGVSRWVSGSRDLMELFVGRTLAYEAEPHMDDTAWFGRAGVYSQHWGNGPTSAWHLTIHTNVRWAKEILEFRGFDDVQFYERYEWDQQGASVGAFVRPLLNEGVNLLFARAENYTWRSNFSGVNDNVVFPIRIALSGHGEWVAWNMTRNGSGDHLKGPVASTHGWSGPRTLPMSIIWMEMINGLIQRDLPLGWARTLGIIAPSAYIPNFYNIDTRAQSDVDCIGDPGIVPWLGIPRILAIDHPRFISEETRMIEVYVYDPEIDPEEEDPAIEGAQVTFYAPGDMPDFDSDDYADYDEMLMITKKSGADGIVRFVFDNYSFANDDEVYVTVTGRDIRPIFGEIEVDNNRASIELAGYMLIEEEGNDDNYVNPGELFSVVLTALNNGNSDLEAVTAEIVSLSPWVEIQGEEVTFGDIRQNEDAEGQGEITMTVSTSCPDGESRPITRPEITVNFTSGDDSWLTGVRLNPVAPNFVVVDVVGDGIIGVGEQDLDLEIENVGGMNSSDIEAELQSLGMGVNVVENGAWYPSLDSDSSSRVDGHPFSVSGNSIVVPGSHFDMFLILTTADDFVDTAWFEVQVGETGENKPHPPDDFGYVCFDDTDDDWEMAPEFEWIEISLDEGDRDFNGTDLEFDTGNPANYVGETVVVDLGFTTQYYGVEYEQISICTNGFIAMGDQGYRDDEYDPDDDEYYGGVTNYQNWPMDRAIGGGAGMLAPFWDDLRLDDESGVYYYNDEVERRFIVEWYNMKHASGNERLTFQVVLYDKRFWMTATGDQMILFQYNDIAQERRPRGGDSPWDTGTEYASVGISSPDGSTGINYTYRNIYPVTSAELADRRAILFATSVQYFSAGYLHGYVFDFETDEPIPNATIVTEYGFAARTDSIGHWIINQALAEEPFSMIAKAHGYNDSTKYDLVVPEDDTLLVDYYLLHPEFLSSTRRIDTYLDSAMMVTIPYSVTNEGNGPLEWSLQRKLPRGADLDPWEHRLAYNLGQQLEDPRIEGVVFANDRFYITGGGGPAIDDNQIYVLDRDSRLVDVFPQPDSSRYGIYDITWDGELLWGGSGGYTVYGFTTEGELITSWRGPQRTNQAITWDTDRELLWITGITANEIVAYDTDGEEQMTIDQFDMRVFGIAYWPDDPDGYPLYAMHSPDLNASKVYKIDIENEDTLFVATLEHPDGGTPRGIFATNQYDVYSWVLMAVANDAAYDRVDVWQIDARRDWFQADKFVDGDWAPADDESDVIDAETTLNYQLTFNSAALVDTLFRGYLLYSHNAVSESDSIWVSLDVIGDEPPSAFSLATPMDGDTILSNTEIEFTWERSVDRNYDDEVDYLVWFSVGDDTLSTGLLSDTTLTIDIATLELDLPHDTTLTWWVQAISGVDEVESRERHSLRYEINDLSVDRTIPVEFGLHSVYPSPFNSSTTVRFGIDRVGRASLIVYDIMGREVSRLYDRDVSEAGNHRVVWDGSSQASGVYILRLSSGARAQTLKVALIR